MASNLGFFPGKASPHTLHPAPLSPQWVTLTILLLFCQLLYLERKRELRTQTQALVETAVETDPFHR